MSTRLSLACDKDFHFYQDMADPECKMRLNLRGEAAELIVEAGPASGRTPGNVSVTVAIPRHVWVMIRCITGESDWGDGGD